MFKKNKTKRLFINVLVAKKHLKQNKIVLIIKIPSFAFSNLVVDSAGFSSIILKNQKNIKNKKNTKIFGSYMKKKMVHNGILWDNNGRTNKNFNYVKLKIKIYL